MNELRDLARRGPIADFVDQPPYPLSLQNMSGVSLRVDDYWQAWFFSRFWGHFGNPLAQSFREARSFFGTRYEFNGVPVDWNEHCIRLGYGEDAHPVTIVVHLRATAQVDLRDAPTTVDHHPVVYERRPAAEAYSLQCGDFLGGNSKGTLGGFLWSLKDRACVAVSCAHVVGDIAGERVYSPDPGFRGKSTEIGTVVHSVFPRPIAGVKCNNRIQANAPCVDAALIELDAPGSAVARHPGVGKIGRVTAIGDMGQNDPIEFYGSKSGAVDAKIKECNIWKELLVDGTPTCFGDLFVLESRSPKYILSQLAQPGDSGSWVIGQAGGISGWDGMVVGGDGLNAYCCYAENVMAAFGTGFALPP